MAIPYYTPPEYGPVATNNNNNSNERNRNNNNYHQNAQVINVRNNNVRNNQPVVHQQHVPVGFFQQLAQELSSVLFNPQVRPERDPLGTPPVNRRSTQQQDQINHTGAEEAGPSTPPRSPRFPLPDIIQCHGQFEFNFCTTTTTNANHEFPRRHQLPVPLVAPEVPADEVVHFELKIGVECYRTTGRDLRHIADDLQRNYNSQNRRPRRPNRLRLSLDMDLMDSVAVVALVLMGGFSYYIFRR